MTIETYTFNSGVTRTKLLVFGAIHGDEICGPAGIRAVIEKLEAGTISLLKGAVTFVPVCHKEAYEKNERCVEEDLNRVFRKTEHPTSKEAFIANELCTLVDGHDAVLDLHSSGAPGPVNAFIDYPTPENVAYVAALGAEFEIVGWPNVYGTSGAGLLSYTTERYAYEQGKLSTTFECGQHLDPTAIPVAEQTILRALTHFGIIDASQETLQRAIQITMQNVIVCEDDADSFAGEWHHLQRVPAGTCIARRASGEEICVDTPSVIIFPYKKAVKGDEWFYLGVES